jgi:hypothetical protein
VRLSVRKAALSSPTPANSTGNPVLVLHDAIQVRYGRVSGPDQSPLTELGEVGDGMGCNVLPQQIEVYRTISIAIQDESPGVATLRPMVRNINGYNPTQSCHNTNQ